ncbi:hypothetical protein K402DRAFT_424856 [Aulographum hederae CBS 113979]|uniref:Uncharacterized protein n=1 Tax=Aulographum hederae CBS 113979 TaxID=1176131 RepID=A0A6G1GN44_9PEZI|nr:hypothetical protein K402DRAFT_424856 [Aulographum hederae CBS 113979]
MCFHNALLTSSSTDSPPVVKSPHFDSSTPQITRTSSFVAPISPQSDFLTPQGVRTSPCILPTSPQVFDFPTPQSTQPSPYVPRASPQSGIPPTSPQFDSPPQDTPTSSWIPPTPSQFNLLTPQSVPTSCCTPSPSPHFEHPTRQSARTSSYVLPPASPQEDALSCHTSKRRRLNDWTLSIPSSHYIPQIRTEASTPCEEPEVVAVEEAFANIQDVCQVHHSEDWLSNFASILAEDGLTAGFEENSTAQPSEEQVCFGMVYNVPMILDADLDTRKLYGMLPVVIDNQGRVWLRPDALVTETPGSRTSISYERKKLTRIGSLAAQHVSLLKCVKEEPQLVLQPLCRVSLRRTIQALQKKDQQIDIQANLSINLYGPLRLFDKVGKYFEACEICLQDPDDCDRNVRYRNPHRLSGFDENATFTLEEQIQAMEMRKEVLDRARDYLSDVGKKEYLPETETPSLLQTQLYSYQKQALSFMLHREKGWDLEGPWPDIWKQVKHDDGSILYLNTITEEISAEMGPQFRGGILADHMGLGKTLSMIALVASDFSTLPITADNAGHLDGDHQNQLRSTLIVVPLPLLEVWDKQLKLHVGSSLKWLRYHGSSRVLSKAHLETHHIVLTTYHTIASEFKRLESSYGSLFTVFWNRIILDEAHIIRERTRLTAQAIFGLRARSRWAVSGTPIQNRLTDVSAIFTFLRVHPYDNPQKFNEDISQLWRDSSVSAAVDRLKNILNCISLRRSSTTISLPKRIDEVRWLHFSKEERAEYDKIEGNAMFHAKNVSTQKRSAADCFYELRRINALRQICNLGVLAPSITHIKENLHTSGDNEKWSDEKAQEALLGLLAACPLVCLNCKKDIPDDSDTSDQDQENFLVSVCLQVVHKACLEKSSAVWCGCKQACVDGEASLRRDYKNKGEQPAKRTFSSQGLILPTKIRAVVEDLESFRTTKSVVFSQWLSTLDQIDQALTARSIPFLRYDSNTSPANRTEALRRFQDEPDILVILFTISCGAVGLDLTAANRAYIVEPHWNPTVEEQALARIHRIGQKRDCTTIRYVMDNTYEDQILKIQSKKRDLINLLLAHTKSNGQGHKARLQELQSLLG